MKFLEMTPAEQEAYLHGPIETKRGGTRFLTRAECEELGKAGVSAGAARYTVSDYEVRRGYEYDVTILIAGLGSQESHTIARGEDLTKIVKGMRKNLKGKNNRTRAAIAHERAD